MSKYSQDLQAVGRLGGIQSRGHCTHCWWDWGAQRRGSEQPATIWSLVTLALPVAHTPPWAARDSYRWPLHLPGANRPATNPTHGSLSTVPRWFHSHTPCQVLPQGLLSLSAISQNWLQRAAGPPQPLRASPSSHASSPSPRQTEASCHMRSAWWRTKDNKRQCGSMK